MGNLGGGRGLRPAEQAGEHLAGLIAVIVDGLFAEEDDVRLFLGDERLEDSCDAKWLDCLVVLHVDASVGPHRQGSSDSFLALDRADGHDHDFVYDTLRHGRLVI